MWWLWKLLQDQRGEDNPADAGLGDAPADGGEGQLPAGEGIAGEGGAGQAGEAPANPRFGEFGDDPNEAATKLFETFTKTKGEYDNFKTKAGLTERNLAMMRQAAQRSGLRFNEETGEFEVVKQPSQERQKRFTDQHKELFDQKVLEAMQLMVQDIFDDQYESRERTTQEKRQQAQAFMREKAEVEELMTGYFPQLDKKNPDFNEAFFNRATEIWHEQYGGNMLKQLSAALRAAQELQIIPQALQKAKVEGVQKGKENKRILSPVKGSGGAPGGSGAMRVLSKNEYLALTPDKKVEYDQWRVEHPDKK